MLPVTMLWRGLLAGVTVGGGTPAKVTMEMHVPLEDVLVAFAGPNWFAEAARCPKAWLVKTDEFVLFASGTNKNQSSEHSHACGSSDV